MAIEKSNVDHQRSTGNQRGIMGTGTQSVSEKRHSTLEVTVESRPNNAASTFGSSTTVGTNILCLPADGHKARTQQAPTSMGNSSNGLSGPRATKRRRPTQSSSPSPVSLSPTPHSVEPDLPIQHPSTPASPSLHLNTTNRSGHMSLLSEQALQAHLELCGKTQTILDQFQSMADENGVLREQVALLEDTNNTLKGDLAASQKTLQIQNHGREEQQKQGEHLKLKLSGLQEANRCLKMRLETQAQANEKQRSEAMQHERKEKVAQGTISSLQQTIVENLKQIQRAEEESRQAMALDEELELLKKEQKDLQQQLDESERTIRSLGRDSELAEEQRRIQTGIAENRRVALQVELETANKTCIDLREEIFSLRPIWDAWSRLQASVDELQRSRPDMGRRLNAENRETMFSTETAAQNMTWLPAYPSLSSAPARPVDFPSVPTGRFTLPSIPSLRNDGRIFGELGCPRNCACDQCRRRNMRHIVSAEIRDFRSGQQPPVRGRDYSVRHQGRDGRNGRGGW